MSNVSRYHRQTLLREIGEEGQRRLAEAHALLVGCGALGSVIADSLVRAGVGRLTLIDRDVVEWTNLQRQVLFDEDDVRSNLPKAEAARRKLERINRDAQITAVVDDFNHTNAEHFADGAHAIIDGLDNFETRYLLNDLSVSRGLPYIYGGAVGTSGMTTTFLPHAPMQDGDEDGTDDSAWSRAWKREEATPCLRCLFESAPPPGASPTCDTVGVLGPAVGVIANIEAAEAIKVLIGRFDAINRDLLSFDVWSREFQRMKIDRAYEAGDCPCCRHGQFDSLAGAQSGMTMSLCGRNAVQIIPASGESALLDLASLEQRLASHGEVKRNSFMLRAVLRDERTPIELTIFPNGRAIVHGTGQPEHARSVYARYIGA